MEIKCLHSYLIKMAEQLPHQAYSAHGDQVRLTQWAHFLSHHNTTPPAPHHSGYTHPPAPHLVALMHWGGATIRAFLGLVSVWAARPFDQHGIDTVCQHHHPVTTLTSYHTTSTTTPPAPVSLCVNTFHFMNIHCISSRGANSTFLFF